MHRQNDPHYFPDRDLDDFGDDQEDDYEMEMECPYCGGDGWNSCDGWDMATECPECGGDGWY